MQNKLTTPEELQDRVSALSDRIDTLKSSMRGKSDRMKVLDELLLREKHGGQHQRETRNQDLENISAQNAYDGARQHLRGENNG